MGSLRMRAALSRPGQMELAIEEVEIAHPGPGQIRVQIHFCGVCHSDLSVLRSGYLNGPAILGHEASGVVEAVGEGVTSLNVGDSVVLTPTVPCGRCHCCLHGEPTLCLNRRESRTGTFSDGTTGLSLGGERVYRGLGVGGFAEYTLADERGAVKISSDSALDVACLMGCAVQTGVGAVVNTAKIEAGSNVLVLGLGGVGASVVLGARAAGAARIIVFDRVEERRLAACRLGATDALDPSENLLEGVRAVTEVGVDYAFEAAGSAALAQLAIEALRPGGTAVLVGVPPPEDAITIQPVVTFAMSGKRLMGSHLGSCNSARDIPRFLAMWRSGQLAVDGLLTGHHSLEEINEALTDMEAARGIRTVVAMRG